jgi:hypothetical protein
MSGLFGAGSRNTQPNRLGSIQVQTSEFGVSIPVLLGTNIVSPKLIDYVHFNATKTSQGGKGGGGVSGYEYWAAVLMLLSKATQYGGADGVGNIYDQSGGQQLTIAVETYTISGGGVHTVAHAGTAYYYDEGVTYQGSYSATVDDFGSDGLATITGFNQLPMARTVGTPGALHYTVSPTGTYTFAAADAGKTVTISYAYTAQATHEAITSAPAEYLRLSFFLGTRPQSPWGYLSANYSAHAHNYPGLVMVADQNMDLGSSANVPTFNFELLNGGKLAFGGGIMDCDPAALVTTILTDPYIGAQFPWLGDLTQLSNYCVANGIFFSPYYETASAASQAIEDLAKLANSEPFWSWDGLLKIVPYGDTTVVGFGRTFTPVTQPLYDLTIDDFIQQGQEEPLAIDLPALADNSNYMKLEFRNRANSYNIDPISDVNQASVQQIGLRPCDTVTAHQITTAYVAQIVLNALLTRKSYPYRSFKFKLNQCFPHIEKMDVVTVTHPNPAYGIVRWPVRLTDIEEDEKTAEITITAEDFPWGAGQPAVFQRAPGGGGGKPGREYPGMIAAPIIFEPMDRMFRSGGPEIWIGVCGQTENWGGCQVFLSTNDTDYAPIGTIDTPARMGTLLSGISSVADPDTTTTFDVVLDAFSPPLVSASSAAADGWQTLSYLDGELIAYSTMTQTTVGGVAVSALSAYTRRGVFASPIAAHGAGAQFLRLDDSVFSYPFDPSLVGQTLHFKFCSFNLVGQMQEALSDVTDYDFLLEGKFGNSGKSIVSNLILDSVVHSGGATADIQIYQVGTSPGTAGTFTRQDGTTLTAPAATITGRAFLTTYYIGFDPATSTYTPFTDYLLYQLHLSYGWIGAGTVTTCDSSGGSGTTGGGGTSGRGVFVSLSSSGSASSGAAVVFTAVVTGTSIQDCIWSIAPGASPGCSVSGSGNSGTFTCGATAHGGGAILCTSVADTTASTGAGVSW